jgi:hypothetical protein
MLGVLKGSSLTPPCSTPSICDFGGTSPPVAVLCNSRYPLQARASRTAANLGLGPNVRNMLGVLKVQRSLRRVARQEFATSAGQAHPSLSFAIALESFVTNALLRCLWIVYRSKAIVVNVERVLLN